MSAKWRLQRTIVTALMVFISIVLLAGAWASLGKFHAEVAVDIAFIALILPPGFYGLFTLIGWQRSAGSGAAPGRFVAWCLRNNLTAFAPLAFMFLLLGLGQNINKAMDRPYAPRSAAAGDFDLADFRQGCLTSAIRAVRDHGGDVTVAQRRIESSCSCLATTFQSDYSDSEKAAWASNADRLRDPKFNRIVQACLHRT